MDHDKSYTELCQFILIEATVSMEAKPLCHRVERVSVTIESEPHISRSLVCPFRSIFGRLMLIHNVIVMFFYLRVLILSFPALKKISFDYVRLQFHTLK